MSADYTEDEDSFSSPLRHSSHISWSIDRSPGGRTRSCRGFQFQGQGSGNLVNYTPATDDGLWRRGVYVIWKRTQPPPGMVAFDAPSREFCSVRRLRTNTPLQALAMFNDVTITVAARMLAARVMGEAASPEERLTLAMRHTVARRPDATELNILTAGLKRRLARFAADPTAAKAVLEVGASPAPATFAPAELAAYAQTCALILNLDETLTRE